MQKRLEELEVGDLVEVPESIKTFANRYNYGTDPNENFPSMGMVSKVYGNERERPGDLAPHLIGPVGDKFKWVSGTWMSKTTPFEMVPRKTATQLRGRILDAFYAHKGGEKGAMNLLPAKCFFGTDPEIFVVDGKGEVVPAWVYLPSRKEAMPRMFNTYVYCYWDGFQAETCYDGGDNCLEVLNQKLWFSLRAMIEAARTKVPDAKFSLKNVVDIPLPFMLFAEKQHVELGCAPSCNVYGDQGKQVADPRELLKRFAGGHQHYGLGKATQKEIDRIVRALDAILAVAGVSLAAEIDDPVRREYYGRAGEYRLPKHGLEYRVLSNFWLVHPAIAMLVNELFRVVIKLAQIGLSELTWKADEDEVRKVVNNCDVEGARKMLVNNSKTLEALFYHTNFAGDRASGASSLLDASVESAMFTVLNGLESIKMPQDIEKNWRLELEADKWSLDHCSGRWHQYTTKHPRVFAPGV